MVRNTYIYPVAPSLRIVKDIITYCTQSLPLFHPISISGYHMHETGATAAQELAFTIANGMEYTSLALKEGFSIDSHATQHEDASYRWLGRNEEIYLISAFSKL